MASAFAAGAPAATGTAAAAAETAAPGATPTAAADSVGGEALDMPPGLTKIEQMKVRLPATYY